MWSYGTTTGNKSEPPRAWENESDFAGHHCFPAPCEASREETHTVMAIYPLQVLTKPHENRMSNPIEITSYNF